MPERIVLGQRRSLYWKSVIKPEVKGFCKNKGNTERSGTHFVFLCNVSSFDVTILTLFYRAGHMSSNFLAFKKRTALIGTPQQCHTSIVYRILAYRIKAKSSFYFIERVKCRLYFNSVVKK